MEDDMETRVFFFSYFLKGECVYVWGGRMMLMFMINVHSVLVIVNLYCVFTFMNVCAMCLF
jgi:hypothetical protein